MTAISGRLRGKNIGEKWSIFLKKNNLGIEICRETATLNGHWLAFVDGLEPVGGSHSPIRTRKRERNDEK